MEEAVHDRSLLLSWIAEAGNRAVSLFGKEVITMARRNKEKSKARMTKEGKIILPPGASIKIKVSAVDGTVKPAKN